MDRPDRLEHYESQVAGWVARLKALGCDQGPAAYRAGEILKFLHHDVLRGGYRLEGTDVAATIDEGRFNCVTATTLFDCLAQGCGLTVRGLQSTGHTMCRVVATDGSFDVETTDPEWRLTQRPTDAVSGSPRLTPSAREVTEVEMVAAIYFNGGVELLGRRRFAEALIANAKALRLDAASLPARDNYLATLNNWAIDLAAEGRFAEAAVLLQRGLALDPAYGPLRVNYDHLRRRWSEARVVSAPHPEMGSDR